MKTHKRNGFTLVELLLVIAIISVMSTMTLVALRGAQDDARASATKAQLNQIRAVLLQEIEEYEFRKMPFNILQFLEADGIVLGPRDFREIKKRIVADMIYTDMPNMELGADYTLAQFPSQEFRDWLEAEYDGFWGDDSSGMAIHEKFSIALEELRTARVRYYGDIGADLNSSSECLYQILSGIRTNGTTGIEVLSSRAFNDVDEDGLLSIVDAWGSELGFQLRYVDDTGADRLLGDGVATGVLVYVDGTSETLDSALSSDVGAFRLGNIQIRITSPNLF